MGVVTFVPLSLERHTLHLLFAFLITQAECRGYLPRSSATKRALVERGEYFTDALISPADLGVEMLALPGQQPAVPMAATAFNPGIVRLPEPYLGIAKEVFPGAIYLACLRTNVNQCKRLKRVNLTPTLDFVMLARRKRQEGVFVVLDAHFNILGEADSNGFGPGRDMRLDVVSGVLVASFRTRGTKFKEAWHMRRLKISKQRGRPVLAVSKFSPPWPDSPADIEGGGRNFGLFWDRGIVRRVVWISQPLFVLPRKANSTAAAVRHLVSSLRVHTGHRLLKLHNNVSPILLDNSSFLLIAHVHLDSEEQGAGAVHPTAYGWGYAHVFLLAERSEPWQVTAQSKPWCLPSTDDARKCETIQFITAALVTAERELVIGYGVNDCDSRVVRLPLDAVVAMTKRGAVTTGDVVQISPRLPRKRRRRPPVSEDQPWEMRQERLRPGPLREFRAGKKKSASGGLSQEQSQPPRKDGYRKRIVKRFVRRRARGKTPGGGSAPAGGTGAASSGHQN